MKKLNLLAVTAVLGATLLTGCGRSVATSANLSRPTRPITPATAQQAPSAYTAPTAQGTTPAATQPTTDPSADAGLPALDGGLEAEITGTKSVLKLTGKRLAVTFKVTNTGASPLSGTVKVDFYGTPGLLNFTRLELVETQSQQVNALAPGQTATFTLTSAKAAKDAQVAVLPAL